jgi:multicomponent Na+:H+ antiporter subunit E
VELPAATSTEAGRAILGNSITLSPGTVTIDVHGDRLLVHCLTRESALALKELEAQRRLARLEQG